MFYAKPVIKIKLSETAFLIEILALLVLIIIWLVTYFTFPNLPSLIPVHFTAFGDIDRYADKNYIFLLPSVATVFYIGLTILNIYPETYHYPFEITVENAEKHYKNATKLIRNLKFLLQLLFMSILTLLATQSQTSNIKNYAAWFFPLSILVVFIPFVYFIVQSFKARGY